MLLLLPTLFKTKPNKILKHSHTSISLVQTTQPTICPGIQQDRGSCAAVSKTRKSTM